MTSAQRRKAAEQCGSSLEYVTSWGPPEDGSDLRPLIAMPNLPRPVHGLAPRTLLGARNWDAMRKACYARADDTCEICRRKPENPRHRQAHEAYIIDYKAGTSTFAKVYCLCSLCHLAGIHTGRAITLYKQGNPLYPKEFLLEGAENAFRLISEYNQDFPEAGLRAYSTFLEYLHCSELKEPMEELIRKYGIKFYEEDKRGIAKWGAWKLIIGNKEYPTPYEDRKAWEEAMAKRSEQDSSRLFHKATIERFSGGAFDEIDEILKNT